MTKANVLDRANARIAALEEEVLFWRRLHLEAQATLDDYGQALASIAKGENHLPVGRCAAADKAKFALGLIHEVKT